MNNSSKDKITRTCLHCTPLSFPFRRNPVTVRQFACAMTGNDRQRCRHCRPGARGRGRRHQIKLDVGVVKRVQACSEEGRWRDPALREGATKCKLYNILFLRCPFSSSSSSPLPARSFTGARCGGLYCTCKSWAARRAAA